MTRAMPTDDQPSALSMRSVLAAAFLTSVCLLPAMLAPYVAGAAARELSLDTRAIGMLAMALIGGVIAVMASSVWWIRAVNWRVTVVAGAICATVGYLCAGQASSFATLLAYMSAASIGTGVAYAPAIAILGDSDNPDRSFGYAFFMQIVLSGLAGFAATQFGHAWGLRGVMGLIGACFALSSLTVAVLPARGTQASLEPVMHQQPLALSIYAGLVGILLLAAGPTAIWVFFERIGEHAGLATATIGNVIAAGLLLGAPGALLSASASKRFGRLVPLALGTLLMLATFVAVVATANVAVYLLCALSFQFLWNFTLAFQYGAVSDADASGRLIVLAPVCQGIGAIGGSGMTGELVHGGSYWPAVIMAAVTSLAGLLLIVRLCMPRVVVARATPVRIAPDLAHSE